MILLSNDGGYLRCWPTRHLRHGQGVRNDPEGSIYSMNFPMMFPEMFKEQKLLPRAVKPVLWCQGILTPVGKIKGKTNRVDSYRTMSGMGREWHGP